MSLYSVSRRIQIWSPLGPKMEPGPDFDQFSNLILFCDLINGDLNDTISDTLNINIFDSWGKCLGSGPSEIKTFEHNFKENYTLNKGKYFKIIFSLVSISVLVIGVLFVSSLYGDKV